MNSGRTVVLPTALQLQMSFPVCTSDKVVEASPLSGMQCMDVSAPGVHPASYPLRIDRIGCSAVIYPYGRIVVGITSQHLQPAVDIQLLKAHPYRYFGLINAVPVGLPYQTKTAAPADL